MTHPTQAEIEAALKEVNDAYEDTKNPYYTTSLLLVPISIYPTIKAALENLSQPQQQEAVGDMTQSYNIEKEPEKFGFVKGWNARGAALTATKPAGWRTIDSAPADCDILLYCPTLCASNEERIEVGYYKNTKGGTMHSWATHWQPLPAPPAEDGEA